ncbi:unnamed protein product [Vicia faba]|uniref:Uncharacterized protein n=1 Tax=Vicia faba TaxID=3906 RepID=A0AAV0Z8H2_VICFA|nr:unnamed protein product [Vicia faba]
MKHGYKLLQSRSVSQTDSTRPGFEFNAGFISSPPTDVVLFGKLISRKTEPGSASQRTRTEVESTSDRFNVFVAGLRSPSGRDNRWRRSNSDRKSRTGIFGTVKFPLQMELSDMKMRQERREPTPLPKLVSKDDGGESYWKLVRPLRRRGSLMRTLKSSFSCISIA